MNACSHQWIDPDDAPITRAPYSPVIGAKRHEMKPGRVYVCLTCAAKLQLAALTAQQEKPHDD